MPSKANDKNPTPSCHLLAFLSPQADLMTSPRNGQLVAGSAKDKPDAASYHHKTAPDQPLQVR